MDAYVFDVNMADWRLVLDVVRSRGWPLDYSSGDTPEPMPDRAEDIFKRRDDCSATLHIRPGAGIVVAAHFFSPHEIEFDLDPNDLKGQEALDIPCSFLRTVGQEVNRQVFLTPKSTPEVPLFVYTPAEDRFIAIQPKRPVAD